MALAASSTTTNTPTSTSRAHIPIGDGLFVILSSFWTILIITADVIMIQIVGYVKSSCLEPELSFELLSASKFSSAASNSCKAFAAPYLTTSYFQ